MDYTWHLIWHSQYGKEEIDSFDTLEEAKKMQIEYTMAFGGEPGFVEIKRRRG
tara:strand:- start:174 stop:332 length:159 start_codon:yes stop_codon:yes gene_type:complete